MFILFSTYMYIDTAIIEITTPSTNTRPILATEFVQFFGI